LSTFRGHTGAGLVKLKKKFNDLHGNRTQGYYGILPELKNIEKLTEKY
jgi:hypothetical protein